MLRVHTVGRFLSLLAFFLVVAAVDGFAIDLPNKEGGLFKPETYTGSQKLELADFPPSQYLRKAETRGSGRGVSEMTVGEISGTVTDGGAAWVLQIASMPGFDVRRLGKPLKVEMTLDAPGHVTAVEIGGIPDAGPLEDNFANAFAALQVAGSAFAVGDAYYQERAELHAGGLNIGMKMQSVVDGTVIINGRAALAVRFAGKGRVADVTGWLGFEMSGYRYVDVKTSAVLRSVDVMTTKGKSNGASFSVSQFNESLIDLPSASRI